jgi:bacterial leucyl aminopeptidase
MVNRNAGSDHMSFTRAGYPAVFASEGNPLADNKFPGEYNPYMHTVKDRIDVDDETGVFSFDVGVGAASSENGLD